MWVLTSRKRPPQLEEALNAYRRATEIDDTDHRGWYLVGEAEFTLGATERAVEAMGKSVALNGENAKGWLHYGKFLSELEADG